MRHMRRAVRADGIALRIDADESHIRIKIAAHALKHRINAGAQAHTPLDIIRNLPAGERANHVFAGAGGGGRRKF